MGDGPGLLSWSQCHHQCPYEREAGGSETKARRCGSRIGSPSQRAGFEEAAVLLEDGGRHKPRNHLEAAKGKRMAFPQSFQKVCSPVDALILASETDFRPLMS